MYQKGQPHTLTIMISYIEKKSGIAWIVWYTYHKMHVTKSEENNSKL
jgi:hypothetical protein